MTLTEIGTFAGWLLLLGVVAAGGWRIARGPTLFDRLIGFDTVTIAVVGWLVLFSIATGTGEYLELIVVVTALGFFTTVAFFYYLSQRDDRAAGHSRGAPEVDA
jgi:multisubunit Na+/H+ antiporter MnhF subunit